MAATEKPPLGRKADKMIRDTLLGAARQNPAVLKNACEAMWLKAGNGDVSAFKEIADRIDGKTVQAIVGSDEHVPVNVMTKMIVEFVGKDAVQ